jgi:hypothetical protein
MTCSCEKSVPNFGVDSFANSNTVHAVLFKAVLWIRKNLKVFAGFVYGFGFRNCHKIKLIQKNQRLNT